MRVLMVLENTFPPDTRVEKEIKSLIEAGYEIVLACSSPTSKCEIKKWHDASIVSKTMPTIIYKSSVGCLRFPFYFNYWSKFLESIFDKYEFDAIHLHDLPLSKVVKDFSVKYKIPFILDLHENWPAAMKIAIHTNTLLGRILSSTRLWYKYERKYVSQVDRIITVVEEMKERIYQSQIDENKIIILPNTLEIINFKTNKSVIKNERPTLFYSGGINIHRGLQIVLQALIEVKKELPNILFNIVGSGSYEKNLKKYVKEQKLESNVVFWGWKSYVDMMDILGISDIAIIPHLRSEQTDCSSPNKLYQYAVMKKPIISSNCISLNRLLLEMEAGVTYNDTDPLALSIQIIKLINDEKLSAVLGEAGHKAVLSKYNWQKDVDALINMYNELLIRK